MVAGTLPLPRITYDASTYSESEIANLPAGTTVVLRGRIPRFSAQVRRDDLTFESHPSEGCDLDGEYSERYAFVFDGGHRLTLRRGGPAPFLVHFYRAYQQKGAIHAADTGDGWTLDGLSVEDVGQPADGTNGVGGGYAVRLGPNMTIARCQILRAASLGLGGVGTGLRISDTRIALCNWRESYTGGEPGAPQFTREPGPWTEAEVERYLVAAALAPQDKRLAGTYDHSHTPASAFVCDPFWEGGGAKPVRSADVLAERLLVDHNGGRGWWPDIDNGPGFLTLDLTALFNAGEGYASEVGGQATLRFATLENNGLGDQRGWLWGGQAILQNVQQNELAGVLAVVHPLGGNGIAVVNQNRGQDRWRSTGSLIRDSLIQYGSAKGRHGYVDDVAAGTPRRGDPPTWERVAVLAPDGGPHVSTHAPLPAPAPPVGPVGARARPDFAVPGGEPPPAEEPEPNPGGGSMEERVAQVDELLVGVRADLEASTAAIADALVKVEALAQLALTPTVETRPLDLGPLTDEELIAERDRIGAEMAQRLITQT